MRIQEIMRKILFGPELVFAGEAEFHAPFFERAEARQERESVSFFGGGGAPAMPKPPQLQLPTPPQIQVPAPPPPPPPPVVQSSLDEEEAEDDARQQAAQRKGIQATLLAGDTGGYTNPATGPNTLLG